MHTILAKLLMATKKSLPQNRSQALLYLIYTIITKALGSGYYPELQLEGMYQDAFSFFTSQITIYTSNFS